MSSNASPARTGSLGAMRATAHPTRVEIMNLLRHYPALTATEFANLLNLSPKTCSYHLHTLATHGLVVEVPAAGRNRPWRRVHADPAPGRAASDNPLRLTREKSLEARVRRDETILDQASVAISRAAASKTWSAAVTVHTRVASMTATELQAWTEDVERLTTRHVRRGTLTDELGEAGRHPVHLMFYGFPTSL